MMEFPFLIYLLFLMITFCVFNFECAPSSFGLLMVLLYINEDGPRHLSQVS